jgi:putative ABC transport system permease protein
MRRSLAERSFVLLLLGIAAGAALLLGVVGLYGVISYVVAQRTREIGVRIALGADVQGVRAWVLRQGLALVATGIVAGLFAAAATTRLLQSLLYDVDARDPVTFLAVTAVLLAVGAAATWVPAMRASRISPLEALRAD